MDNVRFSLAALARDTMSSAQHATTMFLPHRRRWPMVGENSMGIRCLPLVLCADRFPGQHD
jgi:hypothetical protein